MFRTRWRLILPIGILAALFAISVIQGRATTQPLTPEATTQASHFGAMSIASNL